MAALHRWDEIALEKITEMMSQKIVAGEREMLAQIYLKRGALVPVPAFLDQLRTAHPDLRIHGFSRTLVNEDSTAPTIDARRLRRPRERGPP